MPRVDRRVSPEPGTNMAELNQTNKISSGAICGENIDAGAPLYFAADGSVMMAGGPGVTSMADPGAACVGWSNSQAFFAQRDPVTLLTDFDMGYAPPASLMTPGTKLYVDCGAGSLKGRLTTTQPFPGMPACAVVIDKTRIRCIMALPVAVS